MTSMGNKEALLKFFDSENGRDWEEYRKHLSPYVVWTLHGGDTKTVIGADHYIEAIKEAYRGSGRTFTCEALYEGGEGGRIAAILKNDLGERSCDIFEFKDGLIAREHEFLLE